MTNKLMFLESHKQAQTEYDIRLDLEKTCKHIP